MGDIEKTHDSESVNQWLSIGELAQRSGVSVPALRFYEEKSLIWSTRTSGNQRRYHRSVLRRVAIIKVAQQVGISLKQVGEAFAVLPEKQAASKSDWKNMSMRWQHQLDQQIITLLQMRQQLDQCIGCGCLSLQHCPLRNPEDKFAEESAGAHFRQILLQLNLSENQCCIEMMDEK